MTDRGTFAEELNREKVSPLKQNACLQSRSGTEVRVAIRFAVNQPRPIHLCRYTSWQSVDSGYENHNL